jgi:hypothetical protein
MFNARFFVLGFFLATFIFTLVSAAYAFMFVSTVVSGAPASRTLAKRRLSRFARLPFLFAYSDLAAFFLLLNAARSDPFRFVIVRDFFVAFSFTFLASAS